MGRHFSIFACSPMWCMMCVRYVRRGFSFFITVSACCLMCAVRFRIAQGVYDKYIYPAQRIEFCRFHAAHVGNVGKGTYPVPHNGQIAMVHSNGDYFYIAYGKGLSGSDVVQFQIGCTGVFLFGKAVGLICARKWLSFRLLIIIPPLPYIFGTKIRKINL